MDPKVGIYICKGCDIAKTVDVDKLVEEVGKGKNVALCKSQDVMCAREAVEQIKKDIESEELNRVVVGACSPRVFPELFEFGENVLTERVSLREHVAWSHETDDEEDMEMLAQDYVNMGLARVNHTEPPEPFTAETSKDVLVVGGGVGGMTAAKAVADAGYKVHLVEKEDHLGGWAAKWTKVFPKTPPYDSLEDFDLSTLVQSVESHDNITVHKSATVKRSKGQPGEFMVELNNGTPEPFTVGSIILASGWKPYDPKKLGKWGYGVSPDVVTNVQMEEMMKSGEIKRPSDGKAPESIAFIQCAGSRDKDYLPYCSSVCCRVSLKQAKYVREKYPDAKVYIIYKDLRSPQQYEMFYQNAQADEGTFFTKGEIGEVTSNGDGRVTVNVSETLLGEDIQVKADMVVLATGMVPTTKVEGVKGDLDVMAEVAEMLDAGEIPKKEEEEEEAMEDGKKAAAGAEKGARILNLSYRQGTDLPTLKYGFPDSHFICFPYETRRTAVYAVGGVRSPMDLASTINDAYGAGLKAIQAVESVAKGSAVHPRAGDLSYPEFFLQRCTQCKRCTEECPFGALDEDDKGTPKPNPFRCRRCGVCMGACPERIVTFKNYNISMVSNMIKSISMPDEFDEKPRILAFVCENDAMPALEMAASLRMKYNEMIRIIPLRCLGSMNTIWIGDALSNGFDGVILLGCRKGEDYQCHFVRGSELAEYRMENVREKLKQLVLEEERVEVHEVAISEFHKIPKIFNDFLETIDSVGLNPYKGM
ncbi:hydrogenase iron-sulfur subunit [candidate division GN15 bacterium]|nr:hydrogenase iron-sulfur subunit [candidate division GN15 bacterium]